VITFRTPTVRRSRDAEWCPTGSAEHSDSCREEAAGGGKGRGSAGKPGDEHAPGCPSSGRWVVGGVPRDAGGVLLELHVRDEDPGSKDDSLGKVRIALDDARLKQGVRSERYKVEKRRANLRISVFTLTAAMLPGVKVDKHAYVDLSVRVLAETESDEGRMYTIGPSAFSFLLFVIT
jgi:hypothetical protein